MISGETLFPSTQRLDSKFFLHLKEEQCKANPNLAGFMSETLLKATTDETTSRRLVQTALIALEIMGAGDPRDTDYVKVSKESIKQAPASEELEIFEVMEINENFAKALWEAGDYVESINDLLNNFYQTSIDTEYILDNLQVLFKAYWIETQKHKEQY